GGKAVAEKLLETISQR
ncbi:unnamed protein product, partial [Rotaria sp. Silwood1]